MVRRTWHTCQPIDLHRMARRQFLHAQRIELQKMARELGISRATAYRWAGSAEQLVGEVIATMTEETFQRLLDSTKDKQGSERVLEVLTKAMDAANDFQALRKFLKKNPETGFKVVASRDGPVQTTTIACIEQLLQEEMKAGNLELTAEPSVLALAITRIIESFLYADVITGSKSDLDGAQKILQAMLPQG